MLPLDQERAREKSSVLLNATDTGFTARIGVLVKKYGGVSRIARTCGFSEGVIRSWRDGRSDPSRARCVSLARGLGISLLWLMTGRGPMLEDTGELPHGTNLTVDAHRLSDAMRVLQSTLKSTGNTLSVEDRAQLLSEYYDALSDSDPVARVEGIGAIHQHLMERIRQASAHAQDLA